MTVFLHPLCLVDHSSCTDWGTIINITGLDTIFSITCVNHTAAPDTECHMADMSTASVEDQVSGSCVRYTDLFTGAGLFAGCSWQADTELLEDRHGKSGAICTVSQASSTITVRISYELQSVCSDNRTITAS